MNNAVQLPNTDNYWLLAPMVGEISDLEAVILCEPVDKYNMLSYTIIPGDLDCQIINVENDGPTKIVIKFLHEGVYTVEWRQITALSSEDDWQCIYIHNIVVQNIPDCLIFVSCDLLEADTTHSMWIRMSDEINGINQIGLIHLGDQAYMDNIFKESVKLVRKHGCNSKTENQILRDFGKRYYDTWKPHGKILSVTSNYTIWDDHEIKNNMTLDEELPEDMDYVRKIAVTAYQQYQQSLHLNFRPILSDYSWYKRMGSTLLIAIERTSKIISVTDIITAITSYDDIDYINRLILCFSSAPVPRPHGYYGNLYNKLTGDDGTPEKSKFWPSDILADLYRGLFDWMDKAKNREVLIAGGDLHFGTYGIAARDGKYIPVIISSPITNKPTTDRWLASKGMKGTHAISTESNPIAFDTISSKAKRCYAVVNLNIYPMSVTMEYSNDKHPHNMIKYYKTMISFA